MQITKDYLDIKEHDNRLSIKLKFGTYSKFVLIAFGLFTLIGFLIPIIGFFILNANGFSLGFGYLITVMIFWTTSIYFGRLILWNYYGFEFLNVSKNEILYYLDYNWFQDNKIMLKFKELEYKIEKLRGESENMGKLIIHADNDSIVLHHSLQINHINLIINKIDRFIQK